MKGSDVVRDLAGQKTDRRFIKWWRKENDFVDYELVDDFLADARQEQEFAGYELLDLQQMWETLRRAVPGRVAREKYGQREVIVWSRMAEDGTMKEEVCPFTPESVMTIFDVETRGNVLDS
jgi:hypothetical protein